MQMYAYRCTNCRTHHDSTKRADNLGTCLACGIGTLQRRWHVTTRPSMQPHFNETTQKYTTSMQQFTNDLKRAGDEYSERTGQSVNFQPRDWQDLGATSEGLDAANTARSKAGLPILHTPS